MTRNQLLERMKQQMLEYIDDQVGEIKSMAESDEDEAIMTARLKNDRKAVSECTDLEPIFGTMIGWDAPGAILFVFRAAIDDPQNMQEGDRCIPMHWDT